MSKVIGLKQLSSAIAEELTLYDQKIIDGLKKEAKRSMKALVDETKATAPVGNRGVYKKSISSKKLSEDKRSIGYVWYVNGSAYRLSHLLEKGHALRNGGRTHGTHFIQKASDPILEDYIKAVEEVIKNG